MWVWTAPRACLQHHGRAGTQGTAAPGHLSILPVCIGVLVLPKHTPPLPLHTHCHVDNLAAVGFHLLPLPCQEKPLQWPWITCGWTGSLFSLTTFLTSEAGLTQT